MTTSPESRSEAEAARYALVRRLVPVLRHHMVVHLQPMGMICEVMERKLASGGPDAATAVHNGVGKISHLARSAIASCLDVVSWLAPDGEATVALSAGVAECLELVRSNFTFRGFTLVNQIGEPALQLPQPAVREVLTAALLACADDAGDLDELVLAVQPTAAPGMALSLQLRRGSGASHAEEGIYRRIVWRDVQALAGAHGWGMERLPAGVALQLPPG
jgi:hypothetical protein